MSKSNVETVTNTADRIKLGIAVLIIVAGIVAYSVLEDQPTVARLGAFLASLVIAALVAWFSEPGRRAIGFARDAQTEVRRVIWPTRQQAIHMTGIVFMFEIGRAACRGRV